MKKMDFHETCCWGDCRYQQSQLEKNEAPMPFDKGHDFSNQCRNVMVVVPYVDKPARSQREQIHLQHCHLAVLSVGCCQKGARRTGARQSSASATGKQPKESFSVSFLFFELKYRSVAVYYQFESPLCRRFHERVSEY